MPPTGRVTNGPTFPGPQGFRNQDELLTLLAMDAADLHGFASVQANCPHRRTPLPTQAPNPEFLHGRAKHKTNNVPRPPRLCKFHPKDGPDLLAGTQEETYFPGRLPEAGLLGHAQILTRVTAETERFERSVKRAPWVVSRHSG